MFALSLSALILLLTGCGLFGGESLEITARDYYEYRLGHSPGANYTSFFSPAYLSVISEEDRKLLDRKIGRRSTSNSRYAAVEVSDVVVSVDGRYALTMFRGQTSAGMEVDDAVRWVKVGRRWYLHMNSEEETKKYGSFPDQLPLPDLSEPPEEQPQTEDAT